MLPLLAAAMLLLQALGLWHGVLHANGRAGPVPGHAQHAPGGTLVDHDEGDVQCKLYDQLAHADIAFGELSLATTEGGRSGPERALPAGRLAPQAAGFLARGPPPQG